MDDEMTILTMNKALQPNPSAHRPLGRPLRASLAADAAGNPRQLLIEVHRLTAELERSNLELRRTLAEREKMQAILVSTLQSLTVGMLAIGQDGIVIVANPAACVLLERPLEKLAARHIDEILPAGPATASLLLTLQGAGDMQRRVTWQKHRDNQPARQLELRAIHAQAPYDLHLAGVILIEDQTELRQLEQQAQLRSRLTGMGEIAVNLAHEIRNPLGSIALFASTLASELAGDESLGPLAEQIVNGVKSLERLVAGTLEFTRPRRLTLSRVNLADLATETLLYVEHPLRQKAIEVSHNLDAEPEAWITGDAEQLRQVFLNLYINAIQAMDEGGRLRINLARPATEEHGPAPAEWEIAITDDGPGITPELLAKIFDPFFTTKEKGSGIGLAVVHQIVVAHQACITVDSHPSQGATFRLTFPSHREPGPDASPGQ